MIVSAGTGRYAVSLRYYSVGKDRLIVITDAKEGHIGAITLAENSSLQTICKKGHRDSVVSNSVARAIRERLGEDVTVVCGIHIDNATEKEIEILVANAQKCAIRYLEEINHE